MATTIAAPRLAPTDPEYFAQAAMTFGNASGRITELLEAEAQCRQDIRESKDELEARDAAFLRAGLSIDGRPCKNAEERDAVLVELRINDGQYRRAQYQLRQAEAKLTQIQGEIESARDRRSLARASMAWATAMLTYLANTEEQ